MKKKRTKRFSIKKTIRLIIPIFLIILLLIYRNNINIFIKSKITGYKEETISIFLENDIYNDIKDNDYSKTLEEIVFTEYFNIKYVSDYQKIKYQDKDNFFNNINCLLNIGYDYKEINLIYDNFSSESINILLNNKYVSYLEDMININYFHEDKLDRYISYIVIDNENIENSELEDYVMYVNANLDKDYYTYDIKIENPDDINVIVNKYYVLDSNYEPSDLESLDSKYKPSWKSVSLRHEAKIAFQEMCDAAKKDNIYIYGGSGYRSYSYQKNLYNMYKNQDGATLADTYSARAGYSEHQTGLAMDILNANYEYIDGDDKEYTWLINNSYKYGYILRYPQGKENITGYMYEEWHFRYLGTELAKKVYDSGLTYDEYIAKNS